MQNNLNKKVILETYYKLHGLKANMQMVYCYRYIDNLGN